MTTIAAIRTPTSILMGGDSAQHTNGSISLVATPKVFFNGDFLFGVAGSPRLAEIVQYEFVPPPKIQGTSWSQFLTRSFVPQFKTVLGAERDLIEKSAVLVGTKGGGIFEINRNWFVVQSQETYAAIGSGGDFALGSFHSTRGDPRRRLLKALKAAAEFNAYVRPPFTILELPEAGLNEELWGAASEIPDRSALFATDPDDRGWSE
jgi:ATP-dependent protease HslVU (ClpYQ) peptidase subunit